jgi:hypothetical protein
MRNFNSKERRGVTALVIICVIILALTFILPHILPTADLPSYRELPLPTKSAPDTSAPDSVPAAEHTKHVKQEKKAKQEKPPKRHKSSKAKKPASPKSPKFEPRNPLDRSING